MGGGERGGIEERGRKGGRGEVVRKRGEAHRGKEGREKEKMKGGKRSVQREERHTEERGKGGKRERGETMNRGVGEGTRGREVNKTKCKE